MTVPKADLGNAHRYRRSQPVHFEATGTLRTKGVPKLCYLCLSRVSRCKKVPSNVLVGPQQVIGLVQFTALGANSSLKNHGTAVWRRRPLTPGEAVSIERPSLQAEALLPEPGAGGRIHQQ